jgi:hypothetical protein
VKGKRIVLNEKAGILEGKKGRYIGPDSYVRELHWLKMDETGYVRIYLMSCFNFIADDEEWAP